MKVPTWAVMLMLAIAMLVGGMNTSSAASHPRKTEPTIQRRARHYPKDALIKGRRVILPNAPQWSQDTKDFLENNVAAHWDDRDIYGIHFVGFYTGGGPNDLDWPSNETRVNPDTLRTAYDFVHTKPSDPRYRYYMLAYGAADPMMHDSLLVVDDKISDMFNISALPLARVNDQSMQLRGKVIVMPETVPNDRRGVYFVGVRERIDTSLADSMAVMRKWVRNELNNKFGIHDLGLVAFTGYAVGGVGSHTYNGPYVGGALRVRSFQLEALTGERVSDTQKMTLMGQDWVPAYSGDHFNKFGAYVVSPHPWSNKQGHYYQFGVAVWHWQDKNNLNHSSDNSDAGLLEIATSVPRPWATFELTLGGGVGRTVTSPKQLPTPVATESGIPLTTTAPRVTYGGAWTISARLTVGAR